MRGLADLCIRRPVFAAMLIMSGVVVGTSSYARLGVDRFPSVDLPTVSVRTFLPGASTEEMETQVAQRIEEVVNTVEGIDTLRSISSPGVSFVIATFDLRRDIDSAAQDVRDRVATVLRQLPEGTDPPIVSKFDNDQTPVITLAMSGDRPQRELNELADKLLKPRLERSTGVGEIQLVGGAERAIDVQVDPERLRAYGLAIGDVRDALARQNAESPGGNVTAATREASLRTLGKVVDPADFADLVLAERDGSSVRLRDVGRTEDSTKEVRSFARLDGQPAVLLEVRRQSGANTVEVIDGVKRALEALRPELPADVKVEVIRDQSRYIHAALHEITLHLVLGSLLACGVVMLFMRSARSTLIAGVAIPASVITTFGVMAALGFTLNSVTMLALVLMVGIVIDDAIVVLENIWRLAEEKGLSPFDAAREGTAEIALAVLATTLSLAVIFVPVSFMSSISGRFLFQFGITAAAAVLVSLVVSFTLTPMMCSRLLKVGESHGSRVEGSRGGLYGRLERAYLWLLGEAMRLRVLVALLAAVVIASSVPIYGAVRQEYIPSDVDEAEFDINVDGPEGVSVPAMDEAMQRVEAVVADTPGVRLVLGQTGGGFLGGASSGRCYVRIAPHEERTLSPSRFFSALLRGAPGDAFRGNYSQHDVMTALRKRLKQLPDLRCSVRNAPSFNIGGGNFDIDFTILGPELEVLAAKANELRLRSNELGGIVDADTTLKLDRPELRAHIDRERAARLGVDAQDIGAALRIMVGGDEEVTRWRDPAVNDDYDVQLRVAPGDRSERTVIAALPLPGRDGLVRLDEVVRLEPTTAPTRVDRIDRQRSVSLRATVGPGFALGDRLAALRGELPRLELPQGYTTKVMGKGRELERTFVEFLWAFLLSVVLMYLILVSQFESLVHPLTILVSLPLSVPFALFSLWATGNTLNLYSALGILVLFGVVKKNAILQVDHTIALQARGLPLAQAILEANRDRLRPILMTTIALVAGMLPLALGSGPGSEERRAIAVVVIGGQTLSLLLTLLVTPVVFSLMDDLGRRLRGGPPAPAVGHAGETHASQGHGHAPAPEPTSEPTASEPT